MSWRSALHAATVGLTRCRAWCADAATVVLPPICAHCRERLATSNRLCGACRSELCSHCERPYCRRCGAPVGPYLDVENGCDLCRHERFAFSQVVRLGIYEGALASAVQRQKATAGHAIGAALAETLVEVRRAELDALAVDAVVGIPLHWRRRMQRHFDQAEMLADIIAARLGKPRWRRVLRRVANTADQTKISSTMRRKNLRDAFRIHRRARVAGKRLLLVDDVLTTGSTCHYAAKPLVEAGATVFAAFIARGGVKVQSAASSQVT